MVYNIVTRTTLPFRGQVMAHKGKHSSGKGMGSVLLNTGGPGSASSYIDIDDYMETTGRNPFGAKGQGIKGLAKLSDRLSKMDIQPSANIKRKNITMNF
jgi:hypothetical protein